MLRGVVFLFYFFLPLIASAAFTSTAAPLDIGMSPLYPHPGDTVTVTIADYGGNTSNTAYVWSVNGKIVEQGIGKSSISLTAGAIGTAEVVSVLAVEAGTPRSAATLTIRPSSVDIIWEGQTYTPPFFIGRPLPNGKSPITLLAIPHISFGAGDVAENDLIYTWKVNGVIASAQSGFGKSSATIVPAQFGQAFTVSVMAETRSGTGAAENIATIQPQTPTILVYEHAPLLGVRFEKTVVDTFALNEAEASFVAYPLFVGSADALLYTWKLDGQAFAVDRLKPRAVTFKKVGSGGGTRNVSISFQNALNFLERGENSFSLAF